MVLNEILVVHHTHTDLGYTTHPSQVPELHCRIIDQAVELCRQYADQPHDRRFRWTCESAWAVDLFLRRRPKRVRDRFLQLVHEGLIEVTAAPLCPTAGSDATAIRAALQITKRLQDEFHIPIRVAMFCDINGLNWPWADELLDLGVTAVAMAMNYVCGGGMERYTHFRWETPSGRLIQVWHGQHYNMGVFWGLNFDQFDMETSVPERLDELGDYKRMKLLLQVTNVPSDNMGPNPDYPRYIGRYNALAKAHGWPKMRTSTLNEWFTWLGESEPDPVIYRGNWSDWWSTTLNQVPAPTAAVREAVRRLRLAERWLKHAAPISSRTARRMKDQLEEIYRMVYLANEHTMGSSLSVRQPDSFGALGGVAAQENLCYTALYDATSLLRDIVGLYARKKRLRLVMFDPELETVDPTWARITDEAKGGPSGSYGLLPPEDSRAQTLRGDRASVKRRREGQRRYLSNDWLELALDTQGGSWPLRLRTTKGRDLLERGLDGEFGQIVLERPPNNNRNDWFDVAGGMGPDMQAGRKTWPERTAWSRASFQPRRESEHDSDEMAGNTIVLQLEAAQGFMAKLSLGLDDVSSGLDMEYRLWVPFSDDPRSLYILFPFAIEPQDVSAEIGGVWMDPRQDYLPGSCRNWLAVHDAVLLASESLSILWMPLDAPIVMFDSICPNPPKHANVLKRGHLVSWVAHNYWFTNVPGRLGGGLRFRYRIVFWERHVSTNQAAAYITSHLPPTSLQMVMS